MVPVANPSAFRAGTRRNPEDPLDMNRVFPGRADGSTTEQLAHHIYHGIVAGADFLLSLHGWSRGAIVVPYTEYPINSPVTEASLAAARVFGNDYVEGWEWPAGMLAAVAARAGIAAIEPEIGGLGVTFPELRDRYKRGIHNVMRHLSIAPGVPEAPPGVQTVTRVSVTAPTGGVLRRQVELGAAVRAGDPLGTITSLTGAVLATLTAPADGFVAALRLMASVNPGDTVAVLFQPNAD
jgi:hypothetical protein